MICKRLINPFVIILITLYLITLLSACASNKNSKTEIKTDKDNASIKIGLSLDTLVVERWQRDRDIFVARAKELGADVIVQNANNNNEEQLKQVEYLLDQEIDILVIVPHDAEQCLTMVQMAKKKGVKVISYDRLVKNAEVDMYISFDNIKVGQLMAEAITKAAPKGNYLILNGAKTDNNCFMFNNGYKKILGEFVERGDIKIIEEIWAEDWRAEEAFNCVERNLREGKKIDAVIAANDNLAGAAIEALSERRLAGKVPVVGHDADLDGCQRVVEGTQLMTVYKPIDKIANTAAEIAVKMVKGENVQVNGTIYDGKGEVPYYIIQPYVVNRNNIVDTVINDGFHRLDEVFRNLPKSQWPKN